MPWPSQPPWAGEQLCPSPGTLSSVGFLLYSSPRARDVMQLGCSLWDQPVEVTRCPKPSIVYSKINPRKEKLLLSLHAPLPALTPNANSQIDQSQGRVTPARSTLCPEGWQPPAGDVAAHGAPSLQPPAPGEPAQMLRGLRISPGPETLFLLQRAFLLLSLHMGSPTLGGI